MKSSCVRSVMMATRGVTRTAGRYSSVYSKPSDDEILLGCVCYDPSVSKIWNLIKTSLARRGVQFDFVLFNSYERLVHSLFKQHIDIAWNGPVAHVMSQLIGEQQGMQVNSMGMRDSDRDFQTVIVVPSQSGIKSVSDLNNKQILTGAIDSPQGYIVPYYWLAHEQGISLSTSRHDLDLGKHGDTALGEVKVLEDLADGTEKPAILSKMMWDRAINSQIDSVNADKLRTTTTVLSETPPVFDHCQFDTLLCPTSTKYTSFKDALFNMDINNPDDREAMQLEGINECWMPNREEGYDIIRRALRAMNQEQYILKQFNNYC
eukprot:TRINITY_DN25671_c0_g1_i1.p1 TRINITY_DN25671_c0_g1~~TRINITY_DN25671_c0_g1_i1.p1  ORF type:complete len:329 (+),score=68.15 TRINITY_DN25671_c0_g1_i1:31-987(+)